MSLKGTVWTPIGPSPISEGADDNGMVTTIAVHPFNASVIYIGTAAGGVWRTRDGGTTWTPLFDRQPALGIGEPQGLAIDPNNTDVIYAGTSQRVMLGTGNTGVFGLPDSSQGLFKSTDGGNSWIQLGSGFPAGNTGSASNLVGVDLNVIIVDPANSQNLWLGTAKGVRFSLDGGQNWTSGTGAGGDARSLVLDTSSPVGSRILYAGIAGRGAFRSNDGGQNWTQILSGTTAAVAAAVGASPKGFNKVIIAIPPPLSSPNPAGVQVLYVTLEGTGGAPDPVGVFISTDQGATWSQQTATGMPTRTQGGYSFHMAIDPASPGDGANDIIYFGTVGQSKSTNSGASFSSVNAPHADTHAWTFVPQTSPTPSIVFCGNDGGIDTSTDGGSSWTSLNSGGLQTGLFFNIDVKPDATGSVVVGSAQDNGLQTTAGVASPKWNSPQGGDGFDIAYDGVTAGRVYGTSGFWPAPCTRVFVSGADATDLSSTVPTPQDITPWGTSTDQNCGVFPITTSPSNAGHVYVSGNQNLWQTTNGGSSWRIISPFATTGDVDVAAANPNFVVIGVGNQVFVSTNALAATVGPPTGVTFTDITRNLPSRNVARALFDPIDPTIIYAVLGGLNGGGPGQSGHIFRTTVGGTAWTDISPTVGLPGAELNVPCNAIALDGTDVPTTIYVGTDIGVLRSVDAGASWSVLDDIHFPRATVSDLVLNQAAGVLVAATYGRGVFKFSPPTGPVIAVNLQDNLSFGRICQGPRFLTLNVYNVGTADLVINSVQRLMGSTAFTVLATPGTPLVLAAGEEIDFTIQYAPTVRGVADAAIIRISSNDPTAPFVDLAATGTLGSGDLVTTIADSGDFGDVCLGRFADELLTINNSGVCPLEILTIVSTSGDFQVPSVLSYPLKISAGGSTDLSIRFRPTGFGAKSGTLEILSDDPVGLHKVSVFGNAPPPRLSLILADTGDFGKVCVGSFVDRPLMLNNSGRCTLTVTGIASSSGEFIVPEVLSYPLLIAPGDSLPIPIRFEPTSLGSKAGTLTVTSDDPAGPRTIAVSGFAPSGKLALTGSTTFGGVTACCCADRTISICNVGACDLQVTSVRFKRKSPHWKLLHNPFPATLHAGSCLNVVIRYKATEKCPRSCELIIESNDPDTSVKILEILAYTIWEPCRCKDCCEDCRKGGCDGHHQEVCCRQGYPCCCEDDEEDDD
jgi:HYDIN/CFA65/VesB family protein/ASPM-SPD-2-Hydin domain-containing protein